MKLDEYSERVMFPIWTVLAVKITLMEGSLWVFSLLHDKCRAKFLLKFPLIYFVLYDELILISI
jgi:hypothetical protein